MMKLLSTFKLKMQKGFTLVEMLVYIAIFMIVSTASVTFLLSLSEFVDQYKVETALYRSGTNVMEQIILSIRQADQVDTINTIEDLPASGKLTVENAATTTTFEINGMDLELTIDGVNLGDMTYDSVTVDGFTVYHYPLSTGDFVRVRLELTATIGSVTKSITLYGGASVRGSV